MKWEKRGVAKAPVTMPPPRPQKASEPPPVSSGAKEACSDCGSATRKLTRVSPKVLLCATDIRERRKAKRRAAQARRVERVYGLTLEEKEMVIAFQGGGCICAEWTGYNGKTRALSVDHDHGTGVVRGVLCKHCNDLLGRVKDDPRYFEFMIRYLQNPPAVRLFGERIAPEG